MDFNWKEELKKLPDQPGVYIMHDEEGQILYVGKATSLKNRVRSYFQKTVNRGPQILKMIREIAWFETITVSTETEALILECNLIKEHRPRYNTMLTDDKAYPYICLTAEDFPRVRLARNLKRDSNEYFGPYTNATAVRETIRLVQQLFTLRTCDRRLPEACGKERPCLNAEMHRCLAPCTGLVSRETYAENVEKARHFLKGDYGEVLKYLKNRMEEASEVLNFEEAIRYRDLMAMVQSLAEKQKLSDTDGEDRDILAVAADGTDGMAEIFFIRGGRMIGRDHSRVELAGDDDKPAVLSQLIRQFYSGTPYIPREILVEEEPESREALEALLSARSGRKTQIKVPARGEKKGLIRLAAENAGRELRLEKEQVRREEERTAGAQQALAELLGMEKLERIEAYDISHISGFATVGSMVVYEKGRPKKNDYRKFRIRFVEGVNDFASLSEVLYRRFSHGLKEQDLLRETGYKEGDSFIRFPDLILMDGGKGQVSAAEELLAELRLQIPVCGMVKDDKHRTRGLYFRNRELPVDRHSELFNLLTRIQDEVHRFAIDYHRSLRGKAQVHSILDDIPGIGPVRRKALLQALPGIDQIKEASAEALSEIPGMNRAAAETVYAFFHGGEIRS